MGIKKSLISGAAITALVLSSVFVAATGSSASYGDGHGHGGGGDPGGGDGTTASLLVSGVEGASGSTIGPDGALYVAEGAIGQVTRIDTRTGETSPLVTGLPPAIIPVGGAIDVAFIDDTAYVLVTNVGDDVPGSTTNDVVGIYRVDGPDSFTVVADLGEWTLENPPPPDLDYFIARGVLFAMEPVRGGFLVTDAHLNRVLRVSFDGEVELVEQFGNIVPTGLTTQGREVFVAEAGPVPHAPETGKVITFGLRDPRPRDVASGASLLVDVEFGPCGLYALSQGDSPGDVQDGSPALPDSGELLLVEGDGTFSPVAEDLDRPTSVDFSHDTAYVVTLNGEVWKLDDVCGDHGHHGGWDHGVDQHSDGHHWDGQHSDGHHGDDDHGDGRHNDR